MTRNDWWSRTVHEILGLGRESAPRGKKILELLNHSFTVPNLMECVLVCKERKPNYKFMVAEALWMASGMGELAPLARYNSKMAAFSDDGVHLAGAYGPRLGPQWAYVIETLKRDKDSRQAVATIWTPSPRPSKDIPCTVSLQFLIREGRLHVTANMRSSDAWLGLPYDVYSFAQLGNMMAGALGIDRGCLHMNLASSHLYEEHWIPARNAIGGAVYVPSDAGKVLELGGFPPKPLRDFLAQGEPCDPYQLTRGYRSHQDALLSETWAEAFRKITDGWKE